MIYLKRRYRLWRSRPTDGKIKTGCFAQDARGRWYLSLQAEIAESQTCGAGEIGVDLGLSTLATLSDGRKIENPRHFKKYKGALAKAQRARNKKRVRAIHAKIANARRHYLHVQSTKLVRENRLIVVGNVVAKSLPYRSSENLLSMHRGLSFDRNSAIRPVGTERAISRPTRPAVPQAVLRAVRAVAQKAKKACE